MPTQFDTPMFWSEQELSELVGTAIQGVHLCVPSSGSLSTRFSTEKLGKEQAQKDYEQKVIPAIQVGRYVLLRCS